MDTSNISQTLDFNLIRPRIEATVDELLKQIIGFTCETDYAYNIKYRSASAAKSKVIETILQRLADHPTAVKILAASETISLQLVIQQGALSGRTGTTLSYDRYPGDYEWQMLLEKDLFAFTKNDWLHLWRTLGFGAGRLADIAAFMAIYRESDGLKSKSLKRMLAALQEPAPAPTEIRPRAEEKRARAVDRFLAILAGPDGLRRATEQLPALRMALIELPRQGPALKGNDSV